MTHDTSTRTSPPRFRPAGEGMVILYRYLLCDHKGPRTGGLFRGRMPMRCPRCVEAKAA